MLRFNEPNITESYANIFDNDTNGLGNSNVTTVIEQLELPYMRYSIPWTAILVSSYALIFFVGLIGNGMVIRIFIKYQQMRTTTNMLIANLALADIFILIFCVPGTLMSNVFEPWLLGSAMCKMVVGVQGVSVCVSAYTMAFVSIDRYKSIRKPLCSYKWLRKQNVIVLIIGIWTIALLLTLPSAIAFDISVPEINGQRYCIEMWEEKEHGVIYFFSVNLLCFHLVPLIIICVSNLKIWYYVRHRDVPLGLANWTSVQTIYQRTQHNVRNMLSIITLIFVLCWIPLYAIGIKMKLAKDLGESEEEILQILLPLAQLLGSFNSCVNPILYAFVNSKFRNMLKTLLPAWCPFKR